MSNPRKASRETILVEGTLENGGAWGRGEVTALPDSRSMLVFIAASWQSSAQG
jgi:hypothetical protein